MGYWGTNRHGDSFAEDGTGVWGDSPADIIDDALFEINKVFMQDVGRSVTLGEIRAGLEFSLLKKLDDMTYDEMRG